MSNVELLSLVLKSLLVVFLLQLVFFLLSKIGILILQKSNGSQKEAKSFSYEAKQLLLSLLLIGPFERFSSKNIEAVKSKVITPRAFGFANAISGLVFIPGALIAIVLVYALTTMGFFSEVRVLLGREVQEGFVFLQDRSSEKLLGLFLISTLVVSLTGRSFVSVVAALVLLLSFIISVPGAVVLVFAEATGLRMANLFRKQSHGFRKELGLRLVLWLISMGAFFLFGNQMLYLTQGIFIFDSMVMQRLMPWLFNVGIILFLDMVLSLTVLHFYYRKLGRNLKNSA